MKFYLLKMFYLLVFWKLFNNNLAFAQFADPEKTITVEQIVVKGSRLEAEINLLLSPYLDRQIPLDKVSEIETAINQFYQNNGYLVSFAVIPLQHFSSGIVKIYVIEGRLTKLKIKGDSTLREKYIAAQLQKSLNSQPLKLATLESELRLLQLNSQVEAIKANIRPGLEAGNYTLILEILEAPTTAISFSGDNDISPTLGEFQATLAAEKRSLFLSRDLAQVQTTFAEGLDKYFVSYRLPLNTSEGTLTFSYQNNQSDIVEEPFDAVDINGEVEQVAILYQQPFFRSLTEEFSSQVKFDVTSVNSFFFGNRPLSLAEGAEDGFYRVSALRWALVWQTRSTKEVLILGSQISLGLDLFDATNNDGLPDSQFFLWRGQTRWLRALGSNRNTQLVVNLDSQLTFDELLPSEQFVIGGIDTVRGYRQNLIIAESGINASVELRIPLLTSESIGFFQLMPFFDFGTAWNNRNRLESGTLASVGLGVRWTILDTLEFNAAYGIPLIPVKRRGNSLSEDGWHLQFKLTPIKF